MKIGQSINLLNSDRQKNNQLNLKILSKEGQNVMSVKKKVEGWSINSKSGGYKRNVFTPRKLPDLDVYHTVS